jgi:hypothetical protein
MHPFLTKLGVSPLVQDFFEPWYTTDETGNLVFSYGEEAEYFGFAFHRVPQHGCWFVGHANLSMISHVFICDSAMEAICYLNLHAHAFRWPERCLFIAGDPPVKLAGKTCFLIFSKDILGRIRDLKTAALIRCLPLSVVLAEAKVQIRFRQKTYEVPQHAFSLSGFEKLSGYHFGFQVCKPKNANCWLDQLKSDIFNP